MIVVSAIVSFLIAAVIVFFLMRHFYHQRLDPLHTSHKDLRHAFNQQVDDLTVQKEKLEAILSSMVEGVIVIGIDGRLQHVSPNFCQMLELRSKDTGGKLYWEVISNQEINDSIKEALKHQTALKKEIDIIGMEESFFSMQISPVIDRQGQLINLVAVFHEITELKKLERIRTEFVANVSHELKTPLTAIKGFVETLRLGAKDDPQAADRFLNIIDKQTQHLEHLVNDLLVLSSIESKEVKMVFVPESLALIVQAIGALYKKRFEEQNHQLSVEISQDLPKVLVDRQRIEQVFSNLLDNALKFTPAGGKIDIQARVDGAYVRVDIKDNGMGIAAEHLPRIFERFYRVDKSRSKDAGGTGLGLSIVKHIVQAHQGRLHVQSTAGQGSVFSVFLPIRRV